MLAKWPGGALPIRPVARGVQGVRWHPQNLPKGPLLATKWAKSGVFVGGFTRGVRFKKVHFLGPKGPLFGGPAPPKINPGYRPAPNGR